MSTTMKPIRFHRIPGTWPPAEALADPRITPEELANIRRSKDVRFYVGNLPDGLLRVIAAREPWNEDDRLLLHMSASVSLEPDGFREPTDDEMLAVRGLYPRVPLFEDNEIQRIDPCVRQLWEMA